jgi:aspartate ammonia-lyase
VKYRTEKDYLGSVNVPKEAYWGVHTQRALENFDFNDAKVSFILIRSIAFIKKAAAITNKELGYLEKEKADAIVSACDEIIEGGLKDQFPLNPYQGGAGTSVNMNLNEVIANRALEILGYEKGNYEIIHPIKHVNLHQSTNDVFPSAIKIASLFLIKTLQEKIAKTQGAFQRKEKEFANIVKIGRTQLQEAVPMTLGAEFSGYAEALSRDRWRTFKCEERLRVINLGATAIGTGITAPTEYIFAVWEKLRELTGLNVCRAENPISHTAHVDPFVEVSGILKAHASNIVKICNDLRILNLLGEITLQPIQTGSSIMPGKINPVMCEAAIQIGTKIFSNDFLITECASRGTLEICEFLPLLGHSLIESLTLLISLNEKLENYVKNIRANSEKCQEYAKKSPSLITAFLPLIGYEKAEEMLNEFKKLKREDFEEFLKERFDEFTVKTKLSPFKITQLGYRDE